MADRDFDGLADIDPLKAMGPGGNFRHPTRHYYLGSGEEGLRLYQEALEEIHTRDSGPVRQFRPNSQGVRLIGAVGTAGVIYQGIDEVRALAGIRQVRTREEYWDRIERAFGPAVAATGRWFDRDNLRQPVYVRGRSRGSCPYINSLAKDGSRCGRRAASVRGPTRGYDPPKAKRPKGGSCPTMGHLAKDGSRCGRRAASVRGATRGYDGI